MNPIHTYQHIAFLIAKERLNTLEESERKELKLWLSENPVNQSLYEKLKKTKSGSGFPYISANSNDTRTSKIPETL